jgi:hypothetical protein
VFIRILASAYHELTGKQAWTPSQVQAYFALLAPHMKTPFTTESIWVKAARECFQPGSSAPQPRNQLMRAAVDLIVRWALTPRHAAGSDGGEHDRGRRLVGRLVSSSDGQVPGPAHRH